MIIPFAIQSYQLASIPASSQRLVNAYAEQLPPDGKGQVIIYGTPGMTLFANLGSDPIFGMKRVKNLFIAVMGSDVYAVYADGSSELIGSMSNNNSLVFMETDGLNVAILLESGDLWVVTLEQNPVGSGYLYTLTQVTDPDFPACSSMTYIDGYFVFSVADSDQWVISDLRDPTSYDALDFATAEGFPDDLIRVIADHNQLWLMGETSIEIYVNTGAAAFPFERVSGAFVERGCAAKRSVVKDDNTIFWLGDDGIVYRAQDLTPTRISTFAIEYALSTYDTLADAEGWTYTQQGHKFYVITFPSANKTWVFDIATGLWHERESFGLDRWRANCSVAVFNKTLVGDFTTGKIYELDLQVYDENGETIQRIMYSAPIRVEEKMISFNRLQLDFDTGVGLTTGQGSNPQIMLQVSRDGGYTFGNEYWRSLGAIGTYKTRVYWDMLGSARETIFKVVYSEPTKFIMVNAEAEIKVGAW